MTIAKFLENPTPEILTYPHPILRTVCKPVLLEELPLIPRVVDVMFTLLRRHKGLGLSAPQLRLPYRFFIVDTTRPMTFVNPVVRMVGKRSSVAEEGCLSLPGVLVKVSRPTKIKLDFWNAQGDKETAAFEGLTARVVQHELAHLLGKLILDYQ